MNNPFGIARCGKHNHKVMGRCTPAIHIMNGEKYYSMEKDKSRKRTKIVAKTNTDIWQKEIDVSWLEGAAESYNINPDIRAYTIVDIPIVTVDIPNRNLQAFPFEEVSFFDPIHGTWVYNTFRGKPTHIDHDNKNPIKAKGVHFDASLQYVPRFGVWKVRVLAGFDRTKDPYLVKSIENGTRRGYSMGAYCENFVCSICGQIAVDTRPCQCMEHGNGGAIINGRLQYSLCIGTTYFETSSVEDPADPTAWSDMVWT